jgi:amino acid permease
MPEEAAFPYQSIDDGLKYGDPSDAYDVDGWLDGYGTGGNTPGRMHPRSNHKVLGTTAWYSIAAIIVANMLGTGVLSLPYAASALGWLPFSILLVTFAAGALYSGYLFARIFHIRPGVSVFADVAREAYGRPGELIVRFVAYTYLSGVTVIFHITATEALKDTMTAFPGVCTYTWSAMVGAVVLVFLQARKMDTVGMLAVLGVVSILVPVIVTIVVLVGDGRAEGAVTQLYNDDSAYVAKGVAIMDIVFAFAGQVWLSFSPHASAHIVYTRISLLACAL